MATQMFSMASFLIPLLVGLTLVGLTVEPKSRWLTPLRALPVLCVGAGGLAVFYALLVGEPSFGLAGAWLSGIGLYLWLTFELYWKLGRLIRTRNKPPGSSKPPARSPGPAPFTAAIGGTGALGLSRAMPDFEGLSMAELVARGLPRASSRFLPESWVDRVPQRLRKECFWIGLVLMPVIGVLAFPYRRAATFGYEEWDWSVLWFTGLVGLVLILWVVFLVGWLIYAMVDR